MIAGCWGWILDEKARDSHGWQYGNISVGNQAEVMFWETWLGQTFDFFDQRRPRNMFAEFGIHPDAAFG